jgi:hypothetical protein
MTGDDVAREAIGAATTEHDPKIGSRLREALEAMARYGGDRDQLRTKIADSLPTISAAVGAGALSMWLGAEVKNGGNAAISIQPLMTTLLKWTSDWTAGEPNRDEGITFVARAVVAHLVADDSVLRLYSADSELIESLEATETNSPGPAWVLQLLRQRTGSLIVIHAEQRGGVHVRYENVATNFHLFRLMQESLVGKMPGAPSRASSAEGFDVAWWHYGRGDVNSPRLEGSVWGEGSPDDIPLIDNARVLLLWSPILASRSWHGFVGPVIESAPSRLTIEAQLTSVELDRWRAVLNLAEFKTARSSKWISNLKRKR